MAEDDDDETLEDIDEDDALDDMDEALLEDWAKAPFAMPRAIAVAAKA